jgi:hypothetical protein
VRSVGGGGKSSGSSNRSSSLAVGGSLGGGSVNTTSSLARRTHAPALGALIAMVGTSARLYKSVFSVLKRSFCSLGDRVYCSLRRDLLMTMHDARVPSLEAIDKCYKLVWGLDSCVRADAVGVSQLREIHSFLGALSPGDLSVPGKTRTDPRWTGAAIALGDPRVLGVFCREIIAELVATVHAQELPAANPRIANLVFAAQIGADARAIATRTDFLTETRKERR